MEPYSGGTLKAYWALRALSAVTPTRLVTFAPAESAPTIRERLCALWSAEGIRPHVLVRPPLPSALSAMTQGRFQTGLAIERSGIAAWLAQQLAADPVSLILFDDIVFAPLLDRYDERALIAPHDCISYMLATHARSALPRPAALRIGIQSRIARSYERRWYHKALVTQAVTPLEKQRLAKVNPLARFEVASFRHDPGPISLPPDRFDADLLIWADLGVPSIAEGARRFLTAYLSRARHQASARPLLVGRIPVDRARRLLGAAAMKAVRYDERREDPQGALRHGKITVLPDVRGAGLKSRALSVLSSGSCLACCSDQMAGLEWAADIGAINAASPEGLAAALVARLDCGGWEAIASRGAELYAVNMSEEAVARQWVTLVRRAAEEANAACRVAKADPSRSGSASPVVPSSRR